jgi:hypothetical protein
MPLYPTILDTDPVTSGSHLADQRFRLTRIGELDSFLSKEVEERRKIQKKYQRAINITQGVSAGVGVAGLGMETAGITLIATGVGALPGIVLSALGAGAFVIDLAFAAIIRRCATKMAKHAAVMQVANTKLNSIHQLVSKAMIDSQISDEEFTLILNEVERYQTLKEEIRSKARSLAETDEAAKKEWIEKGRQEMRAQFAKHLGVTSPPK